MVGWIHPERDSGKDSVMFYAKSPTCKVLAGPGRLEFTRHERQPDSHLGAEHDEEMRQLVDDKIEQLILGGMRAGC